MNPTQPAPTKFTDFDKDYIESLAQQQGYTYISEDVNTIPESSLYNNPKTKTRELHKLKMVIDGLPCEYYTAQYTPVMFATNNVINGAYRATDGDETSTIYQVQIFAITLPYTIEDLYVESRTNLTLNNILGFSSVVFKNSTKVQLEGDFNNYFRVYVPKDEQLNAFTILAPNIMVRLLENASDYDFEFSDNKIYFYQTFKYFTPGKITLKKKAYDGLLDFGITSAKAMARAARPTERSQAINNTSMWQLYGSSNIKVILQIAMIVFTFFFIILCVVLPPLWPIGAILGVSFAVRYFGLKSKQKRLVADWHRKNG